MKLWEYEETERLAIEYGALLDQHLAENPSDDWTLTHRADVRLVREWARRQVEEITGEDQSATEF